MTLQKDGDRWGRGHTNKNAHTDRLDRTYGTAENYRRVAVVSEPNQSHWAPGET